MHMPRPATAVSQYRCRCASLHRIPRHLTTAARSPCVLVTAPSDCSSLQDLAKEVRQQLGIQALVVIPDAPDSCITDSSTYQQAAPADAFSFGKQLQLLLCTRHEHTFKLSGATSADCVLCAVDQTHGLMQALSLSPVLVLVGVGRGPALSSDMQQHPAVAVAQQAALLGLPAVAACLATTSSGAPMQPAVAASVKLLKKLLPVLQSTGSSSNSSSWGSARNFPRAHFPFPQEGRWALGSQMPLPNSTSAQHGSRGSWGSYDCWALGEDNSWLGHTTTKCSSRSSSSSSSSPGGQAESYRTLRTAFADGDVFICLNVPPTWTQAAGFAATRPGVLWHCWQVEAQQQQQAGSSSSGSLHHDSLDRSSSNSSSSRSQREALNDGRRWSHLYASSSSSSSSGGSGSSSSTSSEKSWQVDPQDLYGRTLPSSSFSSTLPIGTNFVGQDNTRKVSSDHHAYASSEDNASNGVVHQTSAQMLRDGEPVLPTSFTVLRGTLLNDEAACGDVDAVFSGKAAVTLCQTWPAGHPLSCRDELLLAALDESDGGFPSWLGEAL